MKRFLNLMLVLVASISLRAAEDAATMEERRALAEEFLTVTRQEQQLKTGFQAMRDMQRNMVPQMLEARGVVLTAEQESRQKELAELTMRAVEEEMSWEKMRPIMLDAYAGTFSADEMRQLIAFFRSPAGQIYLDKTPLVQKAMLSSIQALALNLQKRLDQEIEEFLSAETEKSGDAAVDAAAETEGGK